MNYVLPDRSQELPADQINATMILRAWVWTYPNGGPAEFQTCIGCQTSSGAAQELFLREAFGHGLELHMMQDGYFATLPGRNIILGYHQISDETSNTMIYIGG